MQDKFVDDIDKKREKNAKIIVKFNFPTRTAR